MLINGIELAGGWVSIDEVVGGQHRGTECTECGAHDISHVGIKHDDDYLCLSCAQMFAQMFAICSSGQNNSTSASTLLPLDTSRLDGP